MSVLPVQARVTKMLNAQILMVPTAVPVKQDSQEMELHAKVRSSVVRHNMYSSVSLFDRLFVRSFICLLVVSSLHLL